MPEVREAEDQAVGEPEAVKSSAAAGGGGTTQLIIKIAVIAAVATVAVLAGYIVTAKVLKPMLAHDPSAASEEVAEAPEPEHGGGGGHGEAAGAGEELLFEVSQIIVNPASTVGSRFLSCSVAFELTKAADLQIFESREIKIRDALITILSARTVDELSDTRSRESLRTNILDKVNQLGDPAKATAVYFKDFVLQ